MKENIELSCDRVANIETRYRENDIFIELINVDSSFITQFDVEVVVKEFGVDEVLGTIDFDELEEYYLKHKRV